MSRIRTYFAVIGDLVDSRGVRDRAALQRELHQALNRFRRLRTFNPLRAAGPEITAGDEFQLLIRADEVGVPGVPIRMYLAELTEDLPVDVAFGIGFGTLSTPLRDSIAQLDGSCFHRAREALVDAKREGRWAKLVAEDDSDKSDANSLHRRQIVDAVNAIFRISGDIRRTWTDRQREVIRGLRTNALKKDVAEALGVSRSVVSEVLGAARIGSVEEAEGAADSLLGWIANPKAFKMGPPIDSIDGPRVPKPTPSKRAMNMRRRAQRLTPTRPTPARSKSRPKPPARGSARRAKPAKRK